MAVNFIIHRAKGGTMDLLNKNLTSLSTVTKGTQKIARLGEDIVNISVESAVKIPFHIGDKITVFGREYKLNRLPIVKKEGKRLFSYDLEFEGVQYDLMRAAYDLTIDTTNNALQDVQADTLTGNLERFATVLIANANRVFPGEWVLGGFPADTEDKTLTFGETDNCLSVAQRICTEYNIEFDIEQNGDVNTLHLRKSGQIFPYTFEYGKGKGLYSLERQNVSSANIVTRLKVFGSTRNITSKYRAQRLCLPGKTKKQSYIEKPDAVAKYGIWEATKYFEDIYPNRTGKVTGLVSGSVLKFVDNTMNFDLNEKEADGVTTKYLLSGVAAKIHFNSGNLSGYEFELQSYDHTTKTFILKPFKNERDEAFPSEKSTAFQFGINDEYKIFDIALPQSYMDTAEVELEVKGDDYYNQNSQPKVQYSLEVAEEFLKSLSGSGSMANVFSVGDYIPVKDDDIEMDKSVRVQAFTRDLLNGYVYQLTISDTVTTNITNRVVSELIDIEKVIKINNLKDPSKAKRDWRSAQELLDMMFDVEGDYYSEKIKPGSIETQMLSVSAKSTQFGLIGTIIQANYNGNKNSVNVRGGVLSHYTIEEDGRIWNLADNTTTLTGDSTPYYIYAKCQRVGTGGYVIFSTSQIKVEQDPDFYHFFVGVVNSFDAAINARSVALTYGFTTINGRFVRTGRIQSNDGNTYFDLDLGEIGGKIKFVSGGSQTDLSNWADSITGDIQDTQQAAADAAAKAQQAIEDGQAAVADFNDKAGELQHQIDGEVSNWFYPYSPTLSNYPASDWTTNVEKDRHVGDTFTNTQPSPAADAGKSWRFVKNSSVYSWTLIADSDAIKALQQAAQAQATADGKSTTFLVQPVKYHLGDTWVLNADRTINGVSYKQGEILTAKQDSTTFVEAHWIKRVRYTDDTAVDNLQIGGVNLLNNSGVVFERLKDQNKDYRLVSYAPSKPLTENGEYTLVCKLKFIPNVAGAWLGPHFGGYNQFDNSQIFDEVGDIFVFYGENRHSQQNISFYQGTFGNNDQLGSYVKIEWACLYEGHVKPPLTWAESSGDVQARIDAEKQRVNEILSDNIADPSEKQYLLAKWQEVQAEYAKYNNQAISLGVSKAAYEAAYSSLTSTIAPIIADITTNSTINGANVRASFQNYYDARSALITALTAKVDELSTQKVNGLQISSVNLLNNSCDFRSAGWNGGWGSNGGGYTIDNDVLFNGKPTLRTVVGNGLLHSWLKLENDVEYTYCAMVKPNQYRLGFQSAPLHMYAGLNSQNQGKITFVKWDQECIADEWKLIYTTFKLIEDADSFRPYFYFGSGSTVFNVAFFGLVKGNRPLLVPTSSESDKQALVNNAKNEAMDYTLNQLRRTQAVVDARSLDVNTYYPVVIKMSTTIPYRIKLYRSLTGSTDGVPAWSTHPNGFVVSCEWTSIGAGYGTIQVRRFIERFTYGWSNVLPVGTIQQMSQSSYEYIHVRGGSRYHFIIEGATGVEVSLKTATFTQYDESVSPRSSVTVPVITTDAINTIAADALAKANASKAITDKFGTTVNGGLISTVMMVLRELNSAYETAGISGIQGVQRNNPAFWAGGTHAKALALIEFLSKMSSGTTPSTEEYKNLAKITMLHDGSAKLGDFIIEESGRILLVDPATGKERLVFSVQNIPSIATLQGTYNPGGGPIAIGAGATSTSQVLSGSIDVTQDGATASFGGTTISISGWGSGGGTHQEAGSAIATLYARRDGTRVVALASAAIFFSGSLSHEYQEDYRTVPQRVLQNLQSGVYTFELVIETLGNVSSVVASSSYSSFSWQFKVADVRRQQYGLDGMMFYYSNHHFHFTEGKGLDIRGTTNMPGVLLSGSVNVDAVTINWWGAKKHANYLVQKVAGTSGIYDIYHSIGHTSYHVGLAPHANRTYCIGTKTNSSVRIYFYTNASSPALSNTGFDFQITGNNYNT